MEQLEFFLIQFLRPDNEARKQAEEQIKRLSKDPLIVPALLHHVRTSPSSNVRQLAAVLLRKKIIGHWMKVAPHVRDSVKSGLLESITVEHSSLVRRSSANVVSVIAKHAVPAGEWPELLPFLFQCSHSAQEDHREVALILFCSLTETIGDILKPHFATLQTIFVKGLQDPESSRVRVAALKAVGALVGCIDSETEVLQFRELIPFVLDVSRQCLANGNDEVAIIAFEIFDELVESPVPVLGASISAIVHFALEVCSNREIEQNVRHQAIQIISWLSKYKPKTLVKYKAVSPILKVMCPLLAEGNAKEDEDDLSIDRAAAEVLDTMAMNLPKKHVFLPVFEFAMSNFQSPHPNHREASVMALGVISEGCFEIMKKKIMDILRLVLQALQDPEQIVRGGACFTLGQFAEHFQPDISKHYQSILPCIFNVLNDMSSQVQEKAYYALAAVCEHLKEEIFPYLEPLMLKLLEALQTNRRDLQATCMSAIGSAAAAAELAFVPYAGRVLEIIKHFMFMTKDEDLSLRARATELVGIIAIAVQHQNIEPVLPMFIEAAILGFSLDYSELREYTHGFLSSVAEVLNEGLVPYLPRIVPLALASCNLDDGAAVDIDDSEGEENMPNGLGGVSSDEDSHDNQRVRNISVRTGALDEKAAATQALGLFAMHTKAAFAPFLSDTLVVLKKHAGYFHEDVRLQAMLALQHIFAATRAAYTGSENNLSPEAKQVFENVMELYLRALNEDDDKETVAQVCNCLAEILQELQFSAVEPYVASLSEAIETLIRQEAVCQQTGDTDSEGDDEDMDHDEILMDAVTDVLPALAKCMGPGFEPILRQQFEPLMKFAKATRPPGDRTMVIACLADIAQEMGHAIIPYIDSIMPIAIKELGSPEANNRRNAAFCVGELCKNGGEGALKYFNSILVALYPLFGEKETEHAVQDNAAGAVARMIMAQPQAIPLAQVLLVFMASLPLKDDLGESATVYNCICRLVYAACPEDLEAVEKAQASIDIQRSFEAFFLKAYALADTSRDIGSSMEVVEILKEALKCPSDGLRKGQALNNLGSVYVDCGKLDLAADCYVRALEIRHTRAHQGLARVFYMRNDRAAAHKEMTKLIEKAKNNASAYEKRSEFCERDRSMVDLNMVTRLDPLRTYPYRYRAAEEKRRLRSLHQVIEDLLFSPDQNDELIVWRSVAGLEDGRSRNLLPLFSFHLRNGGFPVTRRTELSKKQRQHSTLPLQVFVKMLNGSTCIVRVGHADSIASLFSTVSAKEGVPVCLLRLIFAGKQLDGGKSIKDYDIAQDSSISVVLRLRGGMSGRPKSSKGQSALSGRKLLYSEANATSSKPDATVHENPVFQEEILAKEVSEANSWDIDGKISKSDRDSAMLEIIQADKRGFPSLQEAFEANRGSPNKPPVKSRRLDISMDVDLLVVDKDAELMEDVVLETQQPGGNMDCVQQPVPRKSAWGKPPGSNDWSFLGHKTDDYEAIKSSMLKDCKAAFISKRDFLFPEGHTRRVLKAPVAITADQLCTRYIELSECGLFFYFMGRVPFEDDFKRWFKATFQGRCLIKQIKWIGRGFYQVIVGSIQQRDFILGSAVGFNGNFVYTIPWRANFNPADLLAHECPVWVSFPKLSPLLEDEVESIAETLGKVLYVGKGRRACVLWNREKEPPEFLELTTSDGLDLIVEVSFATFPDSCFLCKQAGHFARFCPMAENRKATYAAASGRVPTKPDAEVNLSDKVNAVVTPPLCTMEGSVQEGKGKNKAIPDFFHKSLQNKEVSQDSVAEVLGSDKVNGSGQVVPQSEFTVVQGNKNKGFPSGPRGNTRRSQGSQGRRTIRDFVNKFAALEDDYGLVHVLEDVEPTSPSLKNEGGGSF